MWELDYKESWVPKNWHLWTVVLEKTLESPLDCKDIQSVHPKGDRSWVVIGRTDAEAETPILWPLDVKNWFILKDPDAGEDWRQEKGITEDEMVGWHHRVNGHEFEQAPGFGHGQGSLPCFIPWGCKESDMTEWLNWTDVKCLTSCWFLIIYETYQIYLNINLAPRNAVCAEWSFNIRKLNWSGSWESNYLKVLETNRKNHHQKWKRQPCKSSSYLKFMC